MKQLYSKLNYCTTIAIAVRKKDYSRRYHYNFQDCLGYINFFINSSDDTLSGHEALYISHVAEDLGPSSNSHVFHARAVCSQSNIQFLVLENKN
jgi:hypothetical protein